jgi:TP901 family phage tail tape measure protein
MNDMPQILLTAQLNKAVSIANLKADLKDIEKQLPNINIKYNIDSKTIGNTQQVTAKVTKSTKDLSAQLDILKNRATGAYGSFNKYLEKNSQVAKKLPNEIKNIASEFERLRSVTNVGEMKSGLQKVNSQVAALKGVSRSLNIEGRTALGEFKNDVKKFATFFGAGGIIVGGLAEIKQMYQNVVEIDTAMTDLKKVTDETDVVYSRFLTNTSQKAVELGSKISDVVSATANFARLGYELPDASKLAQVATIYKNVGDVDINTSSEDIISTMKAFNISAKDSISIADKFNEVGNNFAITSAGIGQAMKLSSSALKVANNDLDHSIALLVAGNNVIQSPEIVGNALKTVSLRLTNTKGKLEELGEESEGAAESITKLQTQLLNLTKGKVNIMTDKDTFKSTYDIMLEMSKVWDKMTQKDQASALELMAGKRQANIVASIITNMKDAEKALDTSRNSSGSAIKEQEKWLNSINAKTEQFNANFQKLSTDFINSDFVKGAVDTGSGALGAVSWLTEHLGTIPTLAGAAVAALSLLGKNAGRNMPSYVKLVA